MSFQLSEFQIKANEAIENGNHVLITAHTGSGKTLPAEYAIKYFTERGQKSYIYCANKGA
jgi:ATP-dependent RNA helicase HelY